MSQIVADVVHEFHRHKGLAERATNPLTDHQFFMRPAEHANSIAIIVKHLAGNLFSRWTDFLTSDGEKPTRNRDTEFLLTPNDTRESLIQAWELGWSALFNALKNTSDADLEKTVTIRGEPHRVQQALLRGLTHVSYHVGQILYLARLVNPGGAWLTIPPGQSQELRGGYFQRPSH